MTDLLLMTSNGTGMGHLTRQAAVALALGAEHTATLFSLSLGLPLATGLGIPGEYCPSYDQPWIEGRHWHGYLRDRLMAIVEETGADAVLFDGVAPYPGIGLAAAELRDTAFIWVRRGMWQPGANKAQLRKRRYFDLIIEPGDLAGDADAGPTSMLRDATRIGPMSILEVLHPVPRDEARRRLGLPEDGPVALVTLGSGRLGEVVVPGRVAIEALLQAGPEWHVAVTRSPVAQNEVEIGDRSRLTEITDIYPLARYLSAFDLAVSSAGYNAVHELVPAAVPTLFVANTSTRTDDQVARAGQLQSLRLALAARDDDPTEIAVQTRRLVDVDLRGEISINGGATRARLTGAVDTGEVALAFASGFDRRVASLRDRVGRGAQQAKEAIRTALGEERTETLKRVLGRAPGPRGRRTSVRLVERPLNPGPGEPRPLVFTDALSENDLRRDLPFEHLLEGASDDYARRRRDLIDEYYDVV